MSDPAFLIAVVVLTFLRSGDFLTVFDKPQRDALAFLFIKLRDHQNTAAEILWGLWLLPLAALVYKSRFLPRFLAVWLALCGFCYLALSVTGVLWPEYENKVFAISQPAFFGEVARFVKSDVLMRLSVSSGSPDGVMCFGSRDGQAFGPEQATELLFFLAKVLENTIRAWLDLPE